MWIAAGPGNNGGDALVMRPSLHRAGVAVKVCMPVEVKPDDARWALDTARAAGVPIDETPPASFDGFGWLVDGMFGIGLTRPLEGVFADLAARMSRRSRTSGGVLALDVAERPEQRHRRARQRRRGRARERTRSRSSARSRGISRRTAAI